MTVLEILAAAAVATIVCTLASPVLRGYTVAAWRWLATERLPVEITRLRTRRYEGHHSEPYLDDQFDDQFADDIAAPDALDRMVAQFAALEVHHDDTLAIRDHYRRQAWATALGNTPNQDMGLWEQHLAPHVIRGLTRAGSDDTSIDTDHAHLGDYVVGLAGGDVFDGKGDHWFDEFDAITARAHERLDKARAELLAGLGAT